MLTVKICQHKVYLFFFSFTNIDYNNTKLTVLFIEYPKPCFVNYYFLKTKRYI